MAGSRRVATALPTGSDYEYRQTYL